jgi:hypothetical protein
MKWCSIRLLCQRIALLVDGATPDTDASRVRIRNRAQLDPVTILSVCRGRIGAHVWNHWILTGGTIWENNLGGKQAR